MATQGSPSHLQQCSDALEGQKGGEKMMPCHEEPREVDLTMSPHMFIAGAVDNHHGLVRFLKQIKVMSPIV